MLEALRRSTKSWVAKVLFTVLILSFAVWGIGDVVRLTVSRSPAIAVGKQEVAAEDVAQEFKAQVDRLSPLFGGKLTVEQAIQLGLLDRTIEQMTGRMLLAEAARDLELVVSDDELRRHIAEYPAFRNQLGQFDRDLFRRVLYASGLSEERFLAQERGNLLRARLIEAVAGEPRAPDALVTPLFRHREEKRVAQFLVFAADKEPLPAAPGAELLRQYHKDKADAFMAPELRAITLLPLRPADIAGEIKVTEEMLQEAYDQRAAEFQQPERRVVRQLVFATEAEAAKAAGLAREGRELAAVARELRSEVTELGEVSRDDLPLAELADAAFALPEGGVSAPVGSPLGWHVVKVDKVLAGRTQPLAEVKERIRDDIIRDRAMDRLFELANKVEDILAGGAKIEEAAQRLNLQPVTVPAVDARGRDAAGNPVAAVPQEPALLEAIFATAQGSDSAMVELAGKGYAILRVDSVTLPTLKPFEQVEAEVLAAWQQEQRVAAARTRAKDALARLNQGDDIAAVGTALGVAAETTAPFTRVGGAAGSLPPGLVSELFRLQPGAAALNETDTGAVVARLRQVVPADPSADQALLERMRGQLAEAVEGDVIDQYVGALRGRYGVTVNRSAVETLLR